MIIRGIFPRMDTVKKLWYDSKKRRSDNAERRI